MTEKNIYIDIIDSAIENIKTDRDYWSKEELSRMRTFRAKAASVDPSWVDAVHSEMDAVRTATQRVREDDILLQNLAAIRGRMLQAAAENGGADE